MRLPVIVAGWSLYLLGSIASMHPHDSVQAKLDAESHRALRVVPLPTHYTSGQDVLCLSSDFEIRFDRSLKGTELPKDLLQAVKRTERRLWSNRHQYLSVQLGAEFFSSGLKEGCKHSLKILHVSIDHEDDVVESIMHSAIRPAEERPNLERYTLSVPLEGQAVLKAPTALGALRGLTTFENLFYYLPNSALSGETNLDTGFELGSEQASQLLLQDTLQQETQPLGSKSRKRGVRYAPTAPYEIKDQPAFGWRAVMLDTSRNWFSKPSIYKVSL